MSYKYKLYGAILGDLCGQPHEFPASRGPRKNVILHNPDSIITDDTIMTLASAYSILSGVDIEDSFKSFGNKYPEAGYGKGFKEWLKSEKGTIGNSWGNGCLMRVSPFMYLKDKLTFIIESIRCSHHNSISYESVFRLYQNYDSYEETDGEYYNFKKFEVKADFTIDFCIKLFKCGYSTQRSIIEAVRCGGDTDTNASIVGELCNFHRKDLTKEDIEYVESKLDPFLLKILRDFNKKI